MESVSPTSTPAFDAGIRPFRRGGEPIGRVGRSAGEEVVGDDAVGDASGAGEMAQDGGGDAGGYGDES